MLSRYDNEMLNTLKSISTSLKTIAKHLENKQENEYKTIEIPEMKELNIKETLAEGFGFDRIEKKEK